MRQVFATPKAKDIAWFQVAAVHVRAARTAMSLIAHKHDSPARYGEAHVQVVLNAAVHGTVNERLRQLGFQTFAKRFTKRRRAFRLLRGPFPACATSQALPRPTNPARQRAGTHVRVRDPPSITRALHARIASPHIQCPTPFAPRKSCAR